MSVYSSVNFDYFPPPLPVIVCKGFQTGAEAENKRAGDNRGTDEEEPGRK